MGTEIHLPISEQLLDALAERVADRLAARMAPPTEPFLNVDGAAEYLACKPKRIYELVERGAVACQRDGTRLLFAKEALDAYVHAPPGQFANTRNGHRS